MTELPQLSESDIRDWVGEASFGRGRGYFELGHILNPRRQGNVLKARCIGSQSLPYRVEVTLGPGAIAGGACSCPVGWGGRCKHGAALLLTWLHQPGTFTEIEALETALKQRSLEELVALVMRMLNHYPDLERLLELPVVSEAETPQPVDAQVIRQQAHSALYTMQSDGWGEVYYDDIATKLAELVEVGDDYATRQSWRDAATIYCTVAQEILDNYGMMHDEGKLVGVVNQCVEGLKACLEETKDVARRGEWIRFLFDVYRWDLDYGGIDMGYEAPYIILELATSEEKRQVVRWVRESIPVGDAWSDNYRRQAYGGFLIDLEGEGEQDDETFLRICRETGRWHDLVDRLLALDRVDEAVAIARKVGDYDLLQLGRLFVSHDHGDLAEELIRERARTSQDSRLKEWLKERAVAGGDLETALALAEALFWQRPDLEGYVELRDLAARIGQWNGLRKALLSRLTAEEQFHLLTVIHLEEGEIDPALETLYQVLASSWGWGSRELVIQVAHAAEEERPRAAIRIYLDRVEGLIAGRGRDNYATAASYLVRVRDLYHRLGEQATWTTFIAKLRVQHRRLRALKDELQKAGL
jgi:uncharacterized Zn finger protein